MGKKTKIITTLGKPIDKLFNYLHDNIVAINSSKLFAGIMIIILNIASKFTTIKLSKTMESYLKFTFSRQILVFAIAWMGTRDIYIALLITFAFSIASEFIFNEESMFCFLPKSFTDHHVALLDNENSSNSDRVSEEEIKKAKDVLKRAEQQDESEEYEEDLDGTYRQDINLFDASTR